MQKKTSIFFLLTGIEILDLTFKKSGYNIVFVNEYDDLFMVLYQYVRTQITHLVPLYGHRNDSAERYVKKRGKRKPINLVVKEREKGNLVGFVDDLPCPDFSVAGKNAGVVGENGRLTKVYFDIIYRCCPNFSLFESVKGLIKTEKHRAFYSEIVMRVQVNGYTIDEKVLNALACGASQSRKRVLIVSIQKGIYQNPPDALSSAWNKYAPFKAANILRRDWSKQQEFTVDNPYGFSFERVPRRFTTKYWLNKNDVEGHPNSKDIFQVKKGREKIATIAEGDTGGKSSKRLHRWRYFPTVAYGHNEAHLRPYKKRRTSAAEAMVIQSLPKKFLVLPTLCLSKKFKMIGNGAPYLMAVAIAKTLKDTSETIRRDGSRKEL